MVGGDNRNLHQVHGKDGRPQFVYRMGVGMLILPVRTTDHGDAWGAYSDQFTPTKWDIDMALGSVDVAAVHVERTLSNACWIVGYP